MTVAVNVPEEKKKNNSEDYASSSNVGTALAFKLLTQVDRMHPGRDGANVQSSRG